MISGLQNKIDRLERKVPSSAILTGLTATESQAINTTATDIYWDINTIVINQGIIVEANGAFFNIMSEGLYSITFEGFVSPAVADLQLRLLVADTYDGPWANKKQINCFGFTPRTAFCTTFTHYFKEGNNFIFQMVASATTTLTVRPNTSEGTYPSPVLTIAQLTQGSAESASRNEWYGDPNV